jgi:hypothetical protein
LLNHYLGFDIVDVVESRLKVLMFEGIIISLHLPYLNQAVFVGLDRLLQLVDVLIHKGTYRPDALIQLLPIKVKMHCLPIHEAP